MGTVADLERSRNRHRLADRSGAGALAFSQGRRGRDARSGGGVCVKVLVTGASGQLGRALQASVPAGVLLVALDRAQLDIGDREAVLARIDAEAPDVIINAAAYTAVDKAETERDLAMRINAQAPGHLAAAASAAVARLVHVSTDFVFDGTSAQIGRAHV